MLFKTYARAVSSDSDRKTLHSLYVIRIVLLASGIFFLVALYGWLMLFALSFLAQIAASYPENAEFKILPMFPIVFLVLAIIFVVIVIAFVKTSKKFSAKVSEICSAADDESASPEVIKYRKKLAAYRQTEKKVNLRAMIPLVTGVSVSYILNFVCIFYYSWVLNLLAMIFYYAGIAIFLFVIVFHAIKKSVRGETFKALTASEAEVIDERSGIKSNRFAEEKKTRDTSFLYPFEDLLSRANDLKAASKKRAVIVSVVATALFIIAIFIDFRFFALSYIRLIPPVFIILSYLAVVLTLNPLEKKKNELIIENRKSLSSDEKFSLNLTSFDNYLKRAKNAKVIFATSFIVSAAVGVLIFFFSANYLWFLICAALIIFGSIQSAATA